MAVMRQGVPTTHSSHGLYRALSVGVTSTERTTARTEGVATAPRASIPSRLLLIAVGNVSCRSMVATLRGGCEHHGAVDAPATQS